MSNSSELLDLIIYITEETAERVRDVALSSSYYEVVERNHNWGENSFHVAPILDDLATKSIEELLHKNFGCYFMINEEAPERVISKGEDDGDLCFIVDPLDGSAYARRRIPLASVSLCAYSRKKQKPVASAVADVFLGLIYCTAEHLEVSYLKRGKETIKIRTSGNTELNRASCSALGNQPERFKALMEQTGLTTGVNWLLNTGGALDICRVAAGDLDLNLEFAKGFHIWDIAAAGHILEKAGGVFATPNGEAIKLLLPYERRIPFIAAASKELFLSAQQIIKWPDL